MITGLHHVGMAVENIETQIKFYEQLGFTTFLRSKYVSINADAAMMQKGMTRVELFQFHEPTAKIAEVIGKHATFSSDSLEEDIQVFLDAGYVLAVPIDSGNVVKRYAYVTDTAGNYIELCEEL